MLSLPNRGGNSTLEWVQSEEGNAVFGWREEGIWDSEKERGESLDEINQRIHFLEKIIKGDLQNSKHHQQAVLSHY